MDAFADTIFQQRGYSLKKDFLRICWVESEGTETLENKESSEVQEPPGYIEWVFTAAGETVLGEPRVSTPDSVSEDLESSTCPSPSVETSVLAYHCYSSSHGATSSRTASTSSTCSLPPSSPVPWKSGCTPPPDSLPRECREPNKLCRAGGEWEASNHWKPSPILQYYIWQQQEELGVVTQPQGVERWLQAHVDHDDVEDATTEHVEEDTMFPFDQHLSQHPAANWH